MLGLLNCETCYLLGPQKWRGVKDQCQRKPRALRSSSHLCSSLSCGLRKVIQPLGPWRYSQIGPQCDLSSFPKTQHACIPFARPVSPFCTFPDASIFTIPPVPVLPPFQHLLQALPTSRSPPYCPNLYLSLSSEFSLYRIPRRMFQMPSSPSRPLSTQPAVYVQCKLKCWQGT